MSSNSTNARIGKTRRDFLTAAAGAGAAVMLTPWGVWAADDIDPRVAGIVAGTTGVDTHNHVDVPLVASDVPGPTIDLAGEMKKSGLSAICMTFAVDYKRLTDPDEGYERFKSGLAAMDEHLKRNHMTRSLNLDDLRAAHAAGQQTVVQSVEGAHFLNGKVERIEEAYHRGLRHLGLLHDSDASVPLGDVYTNPPRFGGLTPLGRDAIKECNRLGILVDLAHASDETAKAAMKVSTKPVIVSHTGLDTQLGKNARMVQMMRPRLISKEQAKVVAEAGGVIGVWTHLADSPAEYAQNIRALVDITGIDHVCIGTDTKLTTPLDTRGGQGPRPGVGPGGGSPPGGRIGERTNLAWHDHQVGFYYAVVDAMLKAGFSPEDIGKVGGGNFCRIFGQATTV